MKLTVLPRYRRESAAVKKGMARALKLAHVEPACRRGCSYCCTHAIPYLSGIDGQALGEIVRRRADLADVPERALAQTKLAAEFRKTTPDGLWPLGTFPCVFLGAEGECRIYNDRPFECVVAYSMDAQACADATKKEPGNWARPWEAAQRPDVTLAMWGSLPPSVQRRVAERAHVLAAHQAAPLFLLVAMEFYRVQVDALIDEIREHLEHVPHSS